MGTFDTQVVFLLSSGKIHADAYGFHGCISIKKIEAVVFPYFTDNVSACKFLDGYEISTFIISERSILLHPKSLEVDQNVDELDDLSNNALELFKRKEFEAAIPIWDKVLQIDCKKDASSKNVSVTLNNIGVCLYCINKFEPAIRYFQESIEINTKILGEENTSVARTYQHLGKCYFSLGRHDAAVECFEKASKILKGSDGHL